MTPSSGHYPGVPAYYYVYTPPGSGPAGCRSATPAPLVRSTDPGTSYSAPIATPAGGTWKRVIVSSTSGTGPPGPDERTNFAIWYSFYRTRLSLTKSAASLAFTPLGNTYRVGFLTVEPKASAAIQDVDPVKYLPIADFDATNRVTWFRKLFSQTTGGSSPAREGLARVGRYYGGRSDGINSKMNTGLLVNGILDADPVQYACQQNFTIMTTDGYWNAHTETSVAGVGGPRNLDGTNWVGQQDGQPTCTFTDPACMRPIYDGVSSGREVDTTNESIYLSTVCAAGGYQQTTQHSTSTLNRYTKNSTATQQRTVSYMLAVPADAGADVADLPLRHADHADEETTLHRGRTIDPAKLHRREDDRAHADHEGAIRAHRGADRGAIVPDARAGEELPADGESVAEVVAADLRDAGASGRKERISSNTAPSSGSGRPTRSTCWTAPEKRFSVPSAEPCIIGGQPLRGTTPSSLACAVVVSYGGGGPASNPPGDGNSTALRYDNSSTCASPRGRRHGHVDRGRLLGDRLDEPLSAHRLQGRARDSGLRARWLPARCPLQGHPSAIPGRRPPATRPRWLLRR